METIRFNDRGPAVEDVQQRLVVVGCLSKGEDDGYFGPNTEEALRAFCRKMGIPETAEVDDKIWAALVDATFSMGDRTLYLRMPYMHGHDVEELQNVLGALGFSCGPVDGIFGAFTETALRKFQLNMGLPADGIAGAYTFATIARLHHSWEDKDLVPQTEKLGFARAADVLEQNALCLFGTVQFTRSVAARMSNLALATNPASKIVNAESLSVAPGEDMLMIHVVLPDQVTNKVPRVSYESEETLSLRLKSALQGLKPGQRKVVAIELPGESWEGAGVGRTCQHYAITLLDALCSALQ